MRKPKNVEINVQGTLVGVRSIENQDYISLTDMAKRFGDENLIQSWMRNRNTLELLGIWETLHNPIFKGLEFETFKNEAGLNSFWLTPKKWVDATGAIGIQSRAGRYGGGTFAHQDIAFEFGSWLSPEFKLYLIKEFQRLKQEESSRESLEWDLNRTLSKLNYRIHTDAIKDALEATSLTSKEAGYVYATEADMLNQALFGITAAQWKARNPSLSGNIRDHASVEQLLVLTNLESLNAQLIRSSVDMHDRFRILNEAAVSQLKSLGAVMKGRPLVEVAAKSGE